MNKYQSCTLPSFNKDTPLFKRCSMIRKDADITNLQKLDLFGKELFSANNKIGAL